MTELLLVRHGFSEGNRAKIFQGQLDVTLAAEGHIQAQTTADYLHAHYSIDAIYTSDLTRTLQTAQPLAERVGLPLRKCKDLREIHVGAWQGMKREDVRRLYPENFAQYSSDPAGFRFVEGEDYAELLERGLRALVRISQENDGKTVAVITHGGMIRVLLSQWTGLGLKRLFEVPPAPNCSVTRVIFDKGTFHLCEALLEAHLSEPSASSLADRPL